MLSDNKEKFELASVAFIDLLDDAILQFDGGASGAFTSADGVPCNATRRSLRNNLVPIGDVNARYIQNISVRRPAHLERRAGDGRLVVLSNDSWCRELHRGGERVYYSRAFPGISGCSPAGISYAVEFAVGENGITATNLNSYLASALAAYASGLRVQIDYDNSTSYCYGAIIANGGFSGTC